ncbi:hypothetical protein [Halopenitus sp. POP-27]|uniref:hypothetical protein n=1 Tax=Halopenitus sp. POP-27 TaxID=2994425 RepID=UPI002469A052|nr:hypothetical protein [Halopenitus sp. POP-27]
MGTTDGEQTAAGLIEDPKSFDPKGTLALILVYFCILVTMWVYIYFVEFLGNDLIVVG